MKGCAFSALLSLLSLAAIVAAIGSTLVYGYGWADRDVIAGAALIGGLLAWIAINLLWSAITAAQERAAVVGGLAGSPPVDGRRTVLAGTIEPMGPTLRAPLSGRECVAYAFEVYEMRRSGKSSSKVVYCDGIAVTPSMIVTRAGSFRLLAVPELDCDEAVFDRAPALARAAELMRTAPYDARPPFKRPTLEEQWNDADGAFQRTTRHVEGTVDLDSSRLFERHLERGARVCVFGHYSSSARAIVADPNDWSKITRVMKGDADAIARQLRGSVIRRTIGALIFGAAAAGVIAAFVSNMTPQ